MFIAANLTNSSQLAPHLHGTVTNFLGAAGTVKSVLAHNMPAAVTELKAALKRNPQRSGDLETAVQSPLESIGLEETGKNDPASPAERDLNQPTTVIRNVTAQAPNLTLNVRNKLGRGELYLVAAIGTLLQLGVLVFSGFTAYHPQFRLEWLKNDMPVADYAYPCNATGTLLLVVGMLICSYVVESSTMEDSYRPAQSEGREARVVWLQRSGTVNDQRFESFAVYPQEASELITTSRRKRSQSGLDLVITVVGTVVSLVGFVLQFVGLRGLHWSSSIAQLIATGIMVMLRAWVRRNLATLPEHAPLLPGHELDWLAMTLGANPAKPLWMAGPQHGKIPKDSNGMSAKESPERPEGRGQQSRHARPGSWKALDVFGPEIPTMTTEFDDEVYDSMSGVEYDNDSGSLAISTAESNMSENMGSGQQGEDIPQATNVEAEYRTSPFPQLGRLHRLMLVRRDLGKISDWQGPAATEAIALARAIEITMDSLFGATNTVGDVVRWSLPAIGLLGESSHSGSVEFRVERGETGRWRAFSDEIEAALSLWLYSVYEDEDPLGDGGKQLRRESEAAKGVLNIKPLRSDDDAWLRTKGTLAKRNLKLLGPHTLALHRDLWWWVPDGAARVVAACATDKNVELRSFTAPRPNKLDVAIHRVAGCSASWNYTEKSSVFTAPIPREAIPRDEDINPQWTLAVETHTPLATLYAQHLLTAFMWAAAKEMQPMPGTAEIRPTRIHGTAEPSAPEWQSFEVRDAQIQTLAEDIQGTGIGTLDDVYLAIIPPLSMHNKLPQPDIRNWALRSVTPAEHGGHWEEATPTYLWLFRAARTFPGYNFNRAVVSLVVYWSTVMNGINRSKALYLDHRGQGYLNNARSSLEQALREVDEGVLRAIVGLFTLQGRPLECQLLHIVSGTPETDEEAKAVCETEGFHLQDLHWLALQGRSLEVTTLLFKAGVNVNDRDVLGWTALHYAVSRAGLSRVPEFLLHRQADIHARDLRGRTPLHYAARNGKYSREQLSHARSELTAPDLGGRIPLDYDSPHDKYLVEQLLQAHPRVNDQDIEGRAPLHHAVMGGNRGAMELLIQAGANINLADIWGWTPLHLAAYSGRKDLLDRLQGANFNLRDYDGRTVLHLAAVAEDGAASDSPEVIELLIHEAKLDKHAQDIDRRTPLHLASIAGRQANVRRLIEAGADLLKKDAFGDTALHLAAERGHEPVVQYLIEAGASTEWKNGNGNTPLHRAAEEKHGTVVRCLITGGADANAQDQWGWTPLHVAAGQGDEAVFWYLVDEGGANPEITNTDGKTPFEIAAERHGTNKMNFFNNQVG